MNERTSAFFDAYAHDFSAIYGTGTGPLQRLVNRLFRTSMRMRYRMTIEGCQPVAGRTVLDVGCGPGHYGVLLAQMGAARVTGIDFAPTMIDLARRRAAETGVGETCEFIPGDFLTHEFSESFDYLVLMGFMDYVADPRGVIERALALTRGKAFFSFPAAEGLLAWQRRLRYRRRCDLFMYRRDKIAGLFSGLPCRDVEIKKISRDYFVTAVR